MKTSLLPSVLAMALIAGCASTPQKTNLASADGAKPLTVAKVGCVNDTGSRIQRKPDECRGPGRTFTQDDLQRTGEFDVADALKKLDPSIQ